MKSAIYDRGYIAACRTFDLFFKPLRRKDAIYSIDHNSVSGILNDGLPSITAEMIALIDITLWALSHVNRLVLYSSNKIHTQPVPP